MSIFDKLLVDLAKESFATLHKSEKFIAGQTSIPVTGKVFGKEAYTSAYYCT
jgi:hypothetical protein